MWIYKHCAAGLRRTLCWACKVLQGSKRASMGLQATIMTDPGTADRTYIGPMTPELVEQILDKVSPLNVLLHF